MTFELTLTGAQHELVRRAHTFAEDVIRPVSAKYDKLEECPWDIVDEAAGQGFYNALFYADLIADPTGLSLPLFLEEIFWGCAGIGLTIVLPALALSSLNQAGTPDQIAQWAPEMFGTPGDIKLAALAVSEPQGGSDVAHLQTRAVRDGDDWVLDGTKIWIGNGGIADVTIVNAVVDPDLGTKGQALFVVPKNTPGMTQVRKLTKLGHRASHTAELAFEGCRIPGENLLGGVDKLEHKLAKAREGGETRSGALGTFEQTRPMVAAMALGVARAAFEYACQYAAEREAFGGPIIDNQGVAFPLADIGADIDAARLLCWRASWMAASGVPFRMSEGSMSKLKASEVAVRATEQAVQVLGGWGYVDDHPVEKWYRDAKLYTIFEGTSEIQRMVIGRTLPGATAEGPLHHHLPGDHDGLSRRFGHGSLARARAGEVFLKMAEKAPGALLELGGRLASPGR
ncbi:acyl-CoA dehydrogenase [Marmoricola endophyticus]|uniref:Acyl-CoA dehydrogenase n=1 Tax=Marmoricola endophyticus TaxID=2040280 RepID=A0A917F5X7_9ACTN|nr:acyl-CoA dehydrogenase family protein [Marmoricola endophyticus]GGF52774.1 acyl-CoA dehydrogenase [Marmoricola endophyticus]